MYINMDMKYRDRNEIIAQILEILEALVGIEYD